MVLDKSSILLILQAGSMGVSLTLCLLLVFSRFQRSDTTRTYEQVRMLLAFAMFLLALHYSLQINYGFRAQSDDVGALINILFYSPVAYIIAYATVRIGCGGGYHIRYVTASAISMILIIGCFVGGWIYYGSLQMIGILHSMGLMFFLTIVFFIVYPMKEIRRVSRMMDEESGNKPVQFSQYMRTSIVILDTTAILVPFSIFYTPALVFVGPVFLASLVYYVMCFLALGYNIRQVKNIIDETELTIIDESADVGDEKNSVQRHLSDERKGQIGLLIEEWRRSHGYATSELNSTALAFRLGVPKYQLVQYLREVEGKTFRIWLSDLRLEEAKRVIVEHPEYSNETIAEACGFSRSHLQAKFKEATGLTTNEWREMNVDLRR